jgi:hypothetical protein
MAAGSLARPRRRRTAPHRPAGDRRLHRRPAALLPLFQPLGAAPPMREARPRRSAMAVGSNLRQDLPVYLRDFRRLSCQGACCELNSHDSPASPTVTPAPLLLGPRARRLRRRPKASCSRWRARRRHRLGRALGDRGGGGPGRAAASGGGGASPAATWSSARRSRRGFASQSSPDPQFRGSRSHFGGSCGSAAG